MEPRQRAAGDGLPCRQIDAAAGERSGAGEQRDRIALREGNARSGGDLHLPDAGVAAAHALHLQAALRVRDERGGRADGARGAVLPKHLHPLMHIALRQERVLRTAGGSGNGAAAAEQKHGAQQRHQAFHMTHPTMYGQTSLRARAAFASASSRLSER